MVLELTATPSRSLDCTVKVTGPRAIVPGTASRFPASLNVVKLAAPLVGQNHFEIISRVQFSVSLNDFTSI